MKIELRDKILAFSYDRERIETSALSFWSCWKGYRSEHSRDEYAGENLAFVLEPLEYEPNYILADLACYREALVWLHEHESQIQNVALRSLLGFVHTMRFDYEIDDPELDDILDSEDLRNYIDLTFVRVYSQSQSGMPYYGLEFECNWDVEHGAGILMLGLVVLEVGGSEHSHDSYLVNEHANQQA